MHSLPHLYSIQPTYRPSNSSCWCWNTTFHLMFNVLPQSHHVAIYTRRVVASVLGTWANGVPEMEAAFKLWYAMVNPHHASHGICCRSVLLLPLNRFNSLFNLIWLFAVNFFIFYDWNDKTSSLTGMKIPNTIHPLYWVTPSSGIALIFLPMQPIRKCRELNLIGVGLKPKGLGFSFFLRRSIPLRASRASFSLSSEAEVSLVLHYYCHGW